MKLFLTILALFIITSCSLKSDSECIQNRYWKYGSGFALTDIFILTNENFKNDTIFVDKKPMAVFYKLEDFKSDLLIKSITNNELGTYHDQGKINNNQ